MLFICVVKEKDLHILIYRILLWGKEESGMLGGVAKE